MNTTKVSCDGLSQSLRTLSNIKNGVPKAVYRALNRSVQSVKSHIPAMANVDYTLKRADIKQTLSIKKASLNKLESEILSKGKRTPLGKFKHQPKRDTTGNKRRKVSVEVTKGIKSPVERGFIWRGHIFRRKNKQSREITKEYGPAVPDLLDDANLSLDVQKDLQDNFNKRLEHEISAMLNGYTK